MIIQYSQQEVSELCIKDAIARGAFAPDNPNIRAESVYDEDHESLDGGVKVFEIPEPITEGHR